MSPLDRIAQLSEEVAASRIRECNLVLELSALKDSCALLRSQLAEGQEQAKRDSATIAKQGRIIEDLEEALFEYNF